MKNYKKIYSLIASCVVVVASLFATLTSCTTTADYSLGDELVPGNQHMIVRHRIYRNGVLKEANKEDKPCKIFETRLYMTDSVKSNGLSEFYLGVQNDERFGERRFGFSSQYLFMSGIDDTIGFGYRPIYDSAMFRFKVDTFSGDTTKPIRYNVYALVADIVNENSEDSIFYISYDPVKEGHLNADAKPIYTFEFPNPSKGVYTTSEAVRMQETEHTRPFIKKLLCMEKLDENGMATSNLEHYLSDSAFIRNFTGLYIEADREQVVEGTGSAFSFVPENTGFSVHARTRNPGVDADIVIDTVDMTYYFADTYAVGYGNIRAQRVEYDYSQTEFVDLPMNESDVNRAEVKLGYVDACGGVITELRLTDEFLYSLRDINTTGDDEYSSAAINQAEISVYIDGAEYDYLVMNPVVMGEMMNKSLPRLGMYLNYKSLTPVADYMYINEQSGGVLAYNGYMNRSLACYQMNVTSHFQELMNQVLALEPEADGTLDFSKLTLPRTIYIGPDALDNYSFNRSVIQGANSEINPASIDITLTYTLIK
ncbi:MAG: DUF4270 family protein [Alistipes sp.]|nr:DUF4270 family protein [Alistipes sp.]